MTTTTTLSTINTTSPNPITSHNDTQQNTTPAHKRITTITNKSSTTHILKSLRQHTTFTIPSTSRSPQLCTPKKHLLYQSFQINHPQSRQNLKLHRPNIQFHHLNTCCSPFTSSPITPTTFSNSICPWILLEIQRNAELSIIKIVQDYLTKQKKHTKGNKSKSSNKKVLNYKPRSTTREHKPSSSATTFAPTNTTTAIRNTQSRFKQHSSAASTQYTQPTQKNHASTCNKPQFLPFILLPFSASQMPTTP